MILPVVRIPPHVFHFPLWAAAQMLPPVPVRRRQGAFRKFRTIRPAVARLTSRAFLAAPQVPPGSPEDACRDPLGRGAPAVQRASVRMVR